MRSLIQASQHGTLGLIHNPQCACGLTMGLQCCKGAASQGTCSTPLSSDNSAANPATLPTRKAHVTQIIGDCLQPGAVRPRPCEKLVQQDPCVRQQAGSAEHKRPDKSLEFASARRARLIVWGRMGSRLAGAFELKQKILPSPCAAPPAAAPGPPPAQAGSRARPASSLSPPCVRSRRRCWNCPLAVTFVMWERRPTSTRSSLETVAAPRCAQAAYRCCRALARRPQFSCTGTVDAARKGACAQQKY